MGLSVCWPNSDIDHLHVGHDAGKDRDLGVARFAGFAVDLDARDPMLAAGIGSLGFDQCNLVKRGATDDPLAHWSQV